jgi:hypothetical protein
VNARISAFLVLVLLWILSAGSAAVVRCEPAAGPVIQLNRTKASIEVLGLGPADLANLAQASLDASQWNALFAVYVRKGSKDKSTDPPAVLGSYHVDRDVVRFEPRFPLAPGIHYRVVFHPAKIPGRSGQKREPIVAEILIAKPAKAPTVVQQVHPSGAQLPENHLRFYLHFSAPMRQGEAYQHVHVLDASGKPLDHPFLELDEELWDPQGRRLTLLFHPGRIKKGLKPREELGPILEAGKKYTLVIDRDWDDADGNPLKEAYRRSFQAVAAEENSPDPKTWRLQPPSGGSLQPLIVSFPRPLDHALLERMLWVIDNQGRTVPGIVTVAEQETRWHFTPERPWAAGSYHLVVDTRLEDSAGNSIARPFEVDVFHPIERQVKVETVQLPFDIQAGSPR